MSSLMLQQTEYSEVHSFGEISVKFQILEAYHDQTAQYILDIMVSGSGMMCICTDR